MRLHASLILNDGRLNANIGNHSEPHNYGLNNCHETESFWKKQTGQYQISTEPEYLIYKWLPIVHFPACKTVEGVILWAQSFVQLPITNLLSN